MDGRDAGDAINGHGAAAEAPRPDQLTGMVRDAWRELVGPGDVGYDDDFFAAGGDSLLLVRLADRLHRALNRNVPVHELLAAPTLRGMVAVLERDGGSRGDTDAAAGAGRPGTPSARQVPTSLYQARMAGGDLAACRAGSLWSFGVRVVGELDVDRLAEALTWVTRRHAALRTSFPGNDRKMAECAPADAIDCPLTVIDHPADADPAPPHGEELVRERLRGPFTLSRAPLVRAVLLRRPDDYLLGIAVHSIVFDARSVAVFLADLGFVYNRLAKGDRAGLATEQSDFASFAAAERRWTESGEAAAELACLAAHRPAWAPLAALRSAEPPPEAAGGAHASWSRVIGIEEPRLVVGCGRLLAAAATALCSALREVTSEDSIPVLLVAPRRDGADALRGIGPYATYRRIAAGSRALGDAARQAAEEIAIGLGHGMAPFEALPGQALPTTGTSARAAGQVALDALPRLSPPVLGAAVTGAAWVGEEPGPSSARLQVMCTEAEAGAVRLWCEYSAAQFDSRAVVRLMESMAAHLPAA
jgi:hypothetical protein